MRVAIRAPGALKPRFWAAGVATLAAAFFLFLSIPYGAGVWRAFHKGLFAVALYLAAIRPAQHAAGLFAEERRNQTLGLIYLTGIGSLELFVTKFFSGVLLASSELLALVPFIALPFLSGGVSLHLFLATAACLPTLLLFTMSVTIMISILCTDESQALAWITAVIAAISVVTPLIHSVGIFVAGTPPFSNVWLALSPAYAPYLVFTNFATTGANLLWPTIGLTWVWSLMFILTAAWLLPREWRDDPDTGSLARLKNRYSERLRRSANSPRLEALLNANPFQWLVEQNRTPVRGALSACGGIMALWLLGWAVWKGDWPSPANLYATAFVLVMLVDMFQLNAPAQHIAAHRRDCMFELLLTTPLQPREIVDGQIQGAIRQFRPLRRTLCTLFAIMAAGGLLTRPWTWRALASYFLIWALLVLWAGTNRRRTLPLILWVALNSGRGPWAVMRSHYRAGVWLINFYNFRNLFRSLGAGPATFPSGSEVELFIFLAIGLVALILVAAAAASDKPQPHARLIDEMRAIVQEPVPSPRDPRFRKWKVKERFPQSAVM